MRYSSLHSSQHESPCKMDGWLEHFSMKAMISPANAATPLLSIPQATKEAPTNYYRQKLTMSDACGTTAVKHHFVSFPNAQILLHFNMHRQNGKTLQTGAMKLGCPKSAETIQSPHVIFSINFRFNIFLGLMLHQ